MRIFIFKYLTRCFEMFINSKIIAGRQVQQPQKIDGDRVISVDALDVDARARTGKARGASARF